MMGLEAIRSLASERAAEAAEANLTPLVCDEREDFHRIPFLGDYVPDNWELVESYFVDSSGFGSPDEPALTFDQFIEQADQYPDDGFAITQAGQFQVYIGRYVRH